MDVNAEGEGGKEGAHPEGVAPRRERAYLAGAAVCQQYATDRCGSNVVAVSRHLPDCDCFDMDPGCIPDWW